jgi:hypothetical protein
MTRRAAHMAFRAIDEDIVLMGNVRQLDTSLLMGAPQHPKP